MTNTKTNDQQKFEILQFRFEEEINMLKEIEIELNDLEDFRNCLENKNFLVNEEGIFCNWLNAYFRDKYYALECLIGDKDYLISTICGYIKFQDVKYLENYEDNLILDLDNRCCEIMKDFKEILENFEEYEVELEKELLENSIKEAIQARRVTM